MVAKSSSRREGAGGANGAAFRRAGYSSRAAAIGSAQPGTRRTSSPDRVPRTRCAARSIRRRPAAVSLGSWVRVRWRSRAVLQLAKGHIPLATSGRSGGPFDIHSQKSPYDDERAEGNGFWYAYRAGDIDQSDNRALRAACLSAVPIVYFVGTPGGYQALYPAYVIEDDEHARRVRVTVGTFRFGEAVFPAEIAERRYAVREVRVRLHQSRFRGSSCPPTAILVRLPVEGTSPPRRRAYRRRLR